MNIVFLIGNGFDLNLGMKTRYMDFYDYYKKIPTKSDIIQELKKNIDTYIENWSDLELALGEYTKNIHSLIELDEIYEDILDNLANYLQKEEENFDFSKVNDSVLYDHLIFPENLLLPADVQKIKQFRSQWLKNRININILTFNYTKTLEKIIGEETNVQFTTNDNNIIYFGNIYHIHGYIDNRMILGVNDTSQILNSTFHNNQDILETIVKSNCNQASKHTIDNQCIDLIKSANLICIFGSSLGDTDKLWWDVIIEQLKQNCRLIIFDRDMPIPLRRENLKERIVRQKKNFFLRNSNLSENEKEAMKKFIYVGLNTDLFKLV